MVSQRTQRQNGQRRTPASSANRTLARRVPKSAAPDGPVPVRPVAVQPAPAGRATWCGQIRLGEVRFPVKAFAANVASPDSPLCQVHAGCGLKIQQRKHCPRHGELTAADIGKAYPYGPDRLIPLTAAELAGLKAADDKTVSITRFVAACDFDLCLLAGRSLFLLPENSVANPDYGAVVLAMQSSSAWGIGEVVLSGRRRLVALESRASRLLLHLLHWPAQRRCCPVVDVPCDEPPKRRVTAIARHIAENSATIEWGTLHDDWEQRLTSLVQQKLAPCNGAKSKTNSKTRKSPHPKTKSKRATSKSTG